MLRRLAVTAAILTLNAAAVCAQAATDSTSLLHHDSTSVLRLTGRSVRMEFTELGIERQRRHADSAVVRNAGNFLGNLTRDIVVGVFEGLKLDFPFAQIESVEARGATVVITFPTTRSSNDNSFTFDSESSAAARAFVARVQARLR